MSENKNTPPPSAFEILKDKSNYLRGTITESLNDQLTGALREEDQFLIKFHGTYQQYDRDLEDERKRQKLEPLYSFLIRVRVPGGVTTAQQWLAMDELADKYADGEIKLTTRQAFQLHGVLKRNLKKTIKEINRSLLDTIAACGDVNRNVMSSANPFESSIHTQVLEDAKKISAHFTPQTAAYHEIWLDGKLLEGGEKEEEPIYGKHYLPRKFKIAMAIPPHNDTDVLSNDMGFIAIVEKGELIGYNLTVGGGMAFTFGNKSTYPRVADVVGFFPKEMLLDVAEAVLIFQRDNGNRSDRKNARLKYTVDRLGVQFLKDEVLRISGVKLHEPKPYKFDSLGDRYGWIKGDDNLWHYGMFVEGGKLTDRKGQLAKTAVKEIAKVHKGTFILTGNQNLVIAQVGDKEKETIDAILKLFKIVEGTSVSQMRQNSIACAALPLCGLSFAEAERYLPTLVDKLDVVLEKFKLKDTPITIRMTGCPNGCGRAPLAEIGLIGKAPGVYNLYLGASFTGDRLNKLYKESVTEEQIIAELTPILEDYSKNKQADEHFGDFVIRNNYLNINVSGGI
jgi:sulfite reductase (NADPH) hemoprotein beta-component